MSFRVRSVVLYSYFLVAFCGLPAVGHCFDLSAPDGKFVHLYAGKLADMNMRHFFNDPSRVWSLKRPTLVVAGGGVEYLFFNGLLGVGGEINVGLHSNANQSLFAELVPDIFVRLHPFKKVPFSFAVGDGLSFTTARPRHEEEYGGKEGVKGEQLLNFFFLEAAFGLGENWEVFGRLHHRSNVYGTMGSDEITGSNFPSLGVRYKF